MSSKLQLLGVDTWTTADRLALLQELRATLPDQWADNPPRRDRRADDDRLPWRDELTDLGGEG